MQNSSDLSHFKMKFLDLKNMKPPIVLGNKKFSLKINILNNIKKVYFWFSVVKHLWLKPLWYLLWLDLYY